MSQPYPPAQQTYTPPTQPQFTQPPAAPQQGQFFQQQDPYVQAAPGPVVPPPPAAPTYVPEPAGPVDTSGFFGGAATISFDDRKGYVRGTRRGGQIIGKKITQQRKMGTNELMTWNDGSPRLQMEVTLQTAERADPTDNGQRRLFIKGDLPRAVRVAYEKVGAKDIAEGGWLYVAWVDEKPAKQAGYNPQKVFEAIYAPPGSPDPMAGQPAYTPAVAPPMGQPGPIAQIPQQVMAQAQQYAQQDPAMAAAAGWTPPQPQAPTHAPVQPSATIPQPWDSPDQFAAYAAWQAQHAAQGQQPPAQPGGQPNVAAPPQPAPATPQPAAPGGWSPFA